MDNIKYEMTEKTPLIEGSITSGEMKIAGRSYPEDAPEFFQPFRDWLSSFYQKTKGDIKLVLDLDYINTATNVLLFDIVYNLSKMAENRGVSVVWKYEEDDYEMINKGQDFKELLGDLIIMEERNNKDFSSHNK